MSTSTFGVGEDFDEALLQGMGDAGSGQLSLIERPEQITDLIASEVGELLEIVARDAAIELTAPDAWPSAPYRRSGSRPMAAGPRSSSAISSPGGDSIHLAAIDSSQPRRKSPRG